MSVCRVRHVGARVTDHDLILAVKPRWADLILDGHKTVEVRRTRPPLGAGTRMILYASRPTSSLVGVCDIVAVRTVPVSDLWRISQRGSCCTRDEFEDYFAGAAEGTAIVLASPRRVRPVSLATLRREVDSGMPPHSFRAISRAKVEHLLALV